MSHDFPRSLPGDFSGSHAGMGSWVLCGRVPELRWQSWEPKRPGWIDCAERRAGHMACSGPTGLVAALLLADPDNRLMSATARKPCGFLSLCLWVEMPALLQVSRAETNAGLGALRGPLSISLWTPGWPCWPPFPSHLLLCFSSMCCFGKRLFYFY